jgi:hypothetical protein
VVVGERELLSRHAADQKPSRPSINPAGLFRGVAVRAGLSGSGDPEGTDGEIPMATVVEDRWAPVGSLRGCRRLRLEYDPGGDSAGLDVGDGRVDLVERSGFADHACLAGCVKLEHLA